MLNIEELVKATSGKLINGDLKFIPKEYVIDSRNVNEKSFFIPIIGEKVDGHKFIIDSVKRGICGFFISNKYEEKDKVVKECLELNKDIVIIEVEDTKEALYDAGVYNRQKHINTKVVAVTGSVGKTSTREMIASVLSQKYKVLKTEKNYNSIIGAPIMALKMDDEDICVFEIGTDFVGEIERLSNLVKPNVGVITTIGTAHIQTFKTQENIFKEKYSIVSHMMKNGVLIVNGDNKYLNKVEKNDNYNVIKFFNNEISDITQNKDGISYITKIKGNRIKVKITEIGMHNVINSLCAIKVGECFNLSEKEILNGIKSYKNFSRRMQKIEGINNSIIIDDTYNASFDSMKSGLETIDKIYDKKIAVLGDMLELGDFSEKSHREIGKLFKNLKFKKLYLVGNNSGFILEEAKNYIDVKYFEDINELTHQLKEEIQSGEVVYLKASNSMGFDKIVESIKK